MLQDNINTVTQNIRGTGRDVIIVCATKTVPPGIINSLPSYGLTVAGENKVQELLDKYDKVTGIEWHFIGQLQTNKVKYIIDKVALIHSLDRISLAAEIERRCETANKTMDILIEVNTGEINKGGIPANDVLNFAETVRNNYRRINIRGLMAVMPPVNALGAETLEKNRNLHLQIKELYDKLYKRNFDVKYLSVGMSGDYMTAIKYGANMVRLGSCLFGERNY